MMKYGVFGAIAVLAILVLSTFFGSWYTIDQGERGVILRNGATVGTAEPGLNFKMPFIDSVEEVSIQNHSQVYEKLSIYSADQQPTDMKLSVSYHVPPSQVKDLYGEYGGIDSFISRVLDRKVAEQSKNIFGQYTAVSAIKDRAKLNADIESAIKKAVNGPIVVDSVQIENIDFSDAYEQSIENRMLAEVEVQKIRQNAEREKVQAQITVTQATAQADATKAQALAQATAIKAKGDAEASAIRARGEAEAAVVSAKAKVIAANPAVIELTKAERWNGQLPTTVLPSGTIPFIDAAK